MSQHDPAEDILKTVPVSARLKNQAWDAYWDAPDADALAARLRDMPLPNEVKDALWDAKAGIVPSAVPPSPEGEPPISRTAAIRETLGNVLIGGLKGAAGTATNLGEAALNLPQIGPLLELINRGLFNLSPEQQAAAFPEMRSRLRPTTGAQSVGKAAEQIAEVVVPGRAIASAATSIVPRIGLESAVGAGLAAAQGGSPAVGALAGAVPAITPGTRAIAGRLRTSAEKKVVQALGPTKERYKALAQRLAPDVLRRRLGGSREQLQAQARSIISDVGDQIDETITAYGDRVTTTQPIIEALEAAKEAFRTTVRRPAREVVAGGQAARAISIEGGEAVMPVVFEPRAVRQLEGLQRILSDLGDTARVDQLVAIRRAWDRVVAQAGGFAQRAPGAIGIPLKEQTEAWAKREATGAIRRVLDQAVPELTALNKEFSFWKNLDDVVTHTLQRTQPHGPGLLKQTAEVGGQVVGGLAGSPGGTAGTIGGAVLVGKLAKAAQTIFTSPRWRLVNARLRDQLATAIASGQVERIESAIGRIAAVEGSRAAP